MKKFIFSFLFILFPLLSFASERILDFNVTLFIRDDLRADVMEEITVVAEHKNIRRGIVREIPSQSGHEIWVNSLLMDGRTHPYFTEDNGDDIEVNFGNDDFISPGTHKYVLSYTMQNAVIFSKDFNEVYWNVTGNNWAFPIGNATFRLILPEGSEVINEGISLYTGGYRSKQSDAKQSGHLFFKTTKPLYPGQGFTVAVPFKNPNIKQPLSDKIKAFIMKYVPLVLCVILMIYYLITWLRFGKDPKPDGTVLYAPPNNISPALAGYILKRKFSLSLLSSAFVSLAVKEKIKISKKGSGVEIRQIGDAEPEKAEEENAVINCIGRSKVLNLNGKYQSKVKTCADKVKTSLHKQGCIYIEKNYKFIIFPICIMLLMQIFIFINTSAGPGVMGINIFAMLLSFSLALSAAEINWQLKAYMAVMILIFWPIIFSSVAEMYFLISLALGIPYAVYMDNASPKGREIYLRLLAFKKYMEKAEKHRTELSNPEDKLKIFADYLPYAYAFGIQSKWIQNFTKVLSEEIIEEKLTSLGGRSFIASAAFSSALARSSVQPSSSGGSGGRGGGSFGGGFSGGGFGGGGGRGR